MPLSQAVGLVASLIEMSGLDWPVPDSPTLCRRQVRFAAQIPYRRSHGPATILVDSTVIKVRGDGEWQARKHRASCRRQWRKVHIGVDAQTGDAGLSRSRLADSPLLPTSWHNTPRMKRPV